MHYYYLQVSNSQARSYNGGQQWKPSICKYWEQNNETFVPSSCSKAKTTAEQPPFFWTGANEMNVSLFSPMSSQNVHKNHPFILIIAQIHTIWILFPKSSSSGAWMRVKNRSTACSLLYIQPYPRRRSCSSGSSVDRKPTQQTFWVWMQHVKNTKDWPTRQQLVAMRYCHGCQASQASPKHEQQRNTVLTTASSLHIPLWYWRSAKCLSPPTHWASLSRTTQQPNPTQSLLMGIRNLGKEQDTWIWVSQKLKCSFI